MADILPVDYQKRPAVVPVRVWVSTPFLSRLLVSITWWLYALFVDPGSPGFVRGIHFVSGNCAAAKRWHSCLCHESPPPGKSQLPDAA